MIRIAFTKEIIEMLNYERYHHPHPRVQRKMEALWLKSQGVKHKEIARFTGVTGNVLRRYLKDYKVGGIEKLKEVRFYRQQSELMKHTATLEEHFQKHPPATVKEAMHEIAELTGIKRSHVQVWKFLKRLGLNRRKVGMVPARADLKEQEEFKKNSPATIRGSKTKETNSVFR